MDALNNVRNLCLHYILSNEGETMRTDPRVTDALYGKPASIDRSEVNRALSKAIAYQNVGKTEEAEQWARELVRLLQLADILK
jgi:hypothetical protein